MEKLKEDFPKIMWSWQEEQLVYLLSEYDRLQAENEKMREALGFYAEEENYLGKMDNTPIHRDIGRRARSALKR